MWVTNPFTHVMQPDTIQMRGMWNEAKDAHFPPRHFAELLHVMHFAWCRSADRKRI